MNQLNPADFPSLSETIHWGSVKAHFQMTRSIQEELVSNVSIIPYIGEKYVVFQLENGMWELPGGTLEAGEPYLEALKREAAEELGAELVSYEVFGLFHCESAAPKPYKPHIPHPRFVRLVGYGEVKLVCEPLNPEGGEKVAAVEIVDIEEAISRFERTGRQDIAELYKLAHCIRRKC